MEEGHQKSKILPYTKFKHEVIRCAEDNGNRKGLKKGQFPEIDDAVFKFFHERRKTGLFVSYDLLRKEAIKKARSLNIPRSRSPSVAKH